MSDNKRIIEILKDPPKRKIWCSWCGGRGYHPTGIVSSEDCKRCGGTKSVYPQNYNKTAEMIREIIRVEQALKGE